MGKLKKILSRRSILNDRGFTLTEMLIVIALIGMVMTFVATNLIGKFNRAKVDTTKIQMKQIGTLLDQFKLDCGFYPLTDQGLDALAEKPAGRECKNYDPNGYVKDGKVPKDGFGNDFLYMSEDGHSYELISLGSDGKEGGEGIDKDISSKEID